MREYLQKLVDRASRDTARSMLIRERVLARTEEANIDPHDFDLNPHLQILHIADLTVGDVQSEGFPEVTREEVYLAWLTTLLFHGKAPFLRFNRGEKTGAD